MVQLMPLHPQTPSSLASFKSRLVYLSVTGLEKRPFNATRPCVTCSGGTMRTSYVPEGDDDAEGGSTGDVGGMMHVVGDATETSDGGQRTDDQLDDRHTQGRVALAVQTPVHVQLHTHSSAFYRATPCWRGICYGPVSVCVCVCLSACLSVTSWCSAKAAKHRIRP